tara:strand:+ start:352 stop:477 length:126 start_codon:yes stop_codon:yes gene_type:complete
MNIKTNSLAREKENFRTSQKELKITTKTFISISPLDDMQTR